MDQQSSFDSESMNHEYDPLVTADSFIFESPNLEEAMASCPESLGDQAMAFCADPQSLDDKRKPSPTNVAGNPEQVKQPSPTTKKKRASTNTDGNGCKGCKCKKSQCLKLYCECFAAGISCTDPCCCQGCLNIPEYEDRVLETKKQIESRDQLAFLCKFVPQSTVPASNDNNDTEDANVMTASRARHKRGCNCKKSMCHKKYCECYRANVGCFNGCGCEGCRNDYGTKDYVARAPLDQSSPSSASSSNTEELTNIPQPQGYLPWPGFGEKQCVQSHDSDFAQRSEEVVYPAATNQTDYLQQKISLNMLNMETKSHNTNVTSNQVEPAPGPSNEPLHQGLVLQPQLHITLPRRQAQSQKSIAPQPSSLARNPSQNIGQSDMFPGSHRHMLGRRQQVFPQQLQQQQQQQSQNPQQQQQPSQLQQPSMMQTSFLPSLLQQPNNNVQHSTQFTLQQHSLLIRQQKSSTVHQQRKPMTLTQQPLLHEQQQHQLMGPRSNATNIQVHAHMLGVPNNVGDREQADRLILQQNNLTHVFSQFPPPFF